MVSFAAAAAAAAAVVARQQETTDGPLSHARLTSRGGDRSLCFWFLKVDRRQHTSSSQHYTCLSCLSALRVCACRVGVVNRRRQGKAMAAVGRPKRVLRLPPGRRRRDDQQCTALHTLRLLAAALLPLGGTINKGAWHIVRASKRGRSKVKWTQHTETIKNNLGDESR